MKNFMKRGSSTSQEVHNDTVHDVVQAEEAINYTGKSTWSKIWPVMAAGSGLFSEGYLQNVIGSVNVMLGNIYGKAFTQSTAKQNTSSITFVGIVLGMLVFGYTSDKWSRSNTLLVSTAIVFVFAVLSTGSYGAGGSAGGLFAALTAYRFFLGFGIGGEYPAGSVAAAEATGETKAGSRNTLFVMFTNVAIDWGFVIGAFVPYVVIVITGDSTADQVAAWRWCLGIGCVFPLAVFLLRLKLKEPEEYKRESMKHVSIPYGLVIKFYWKRLAVIMLIWFLYDFSAYAFGIYSSTIVDIVIPDASLAVQFGWNTVINLFYVPGAIIGGPVSDWIGPRYALALGVTIQAIIGYIMAGDIVNLQNNIAAFCVVYGLFLSFGELGPGDNIGLIASKTCATGVRGQYYGIAAAFGKVGAFVGGYAFPALIARGGNDVTKQLQYPFWVASSLCIFAAALAIFCLPHIGQDTITHEDLRFREYLESQGFDTTRLGVEPNTARDDVSPVFMEHSGAGKEL